MPLINKPQNINKVWASSGDRVAPSDQKINQGWVPEIPPHQWFNFIDNKQDQAIAHINQMGIPQWDAVTEYQADKSYVQGPTNGVVYRATQTHTNQNPQVTSGYWEVAFLTQAPDYDTTYVRLNQNLADIPNKTQARNNLSVYSTAQVDTLLDTTVKSSQFTGASNQRLQAKGFQKLPGGIIIQWGPVLAGVNTFQIPFPNNIFSLACDSRNGSSGPDIANKTQQGFTAGQVAGGLETYIAIGN